MTHLEENSLLSDNEHGFRIKRSCESQLMLFVDELAKNMFKGKQTDVATLDFSKAFDVVPHKRLLHKLDFYGIQGSALFWISSFLSNRTSGCRWRVLRCCTGHLRSTIGFSPRANPLLGIH